MIISFFFNNKLKSYFIDLWMKIMQVSSSLVQHHGPFKLALMPTDAYIVYLDQVQILMMWTPKNKLGFLSRECLVLLLGVGHHLFLLRSELGLAPLCCVLHWGSGWVSILLWENPSFFYRKVVRNFKWLLWKSCSEYYYYLSGLKTLCLARAWPNAFLISSSKRFGRKVGVFGSLWYSEQL